MLRSGTFFCLVLCLISGVHTVDHRSTNRLSQRNVNTNTRITQLMTGQHSRLTESFIFVVRDSENYSRLRQIINDLPAIPPDPFDAKAYVAIFLGQRRTSGFNIDLSVDRNGMLMVTETKPPPGAMVKMVLSAPFKVFAISVQPDETLSFLVDETWKRQLLSFRLTKVAGRLATDRSHLEGSVQLMRSGSYLTCFFNLAEAGAKSPVNDVSSAEVDTNGEFLLSPISLMKTFGRQPRLTGKLENKKGHSLLIFQTSDGSTLSLTDRP